MGLLAPVASIMQCMDYLNSQYKVCVQRTVVLGLLLLLPGRCNITAVRTCVPRLASWAQPALSQAARWPLLPHPRCPPRTRCPAQAHHPAKVLPTAYNAMCMAAIFTLFFLGPTFWTSKRGRMITGYLLYVAALILPSLVDVVLLDAASGQAAQAWEGRHGMALWAGGSAAAGAADAIISSVVYGEAATLGSSFTHVGV
jgi:hypothetical protein